MQTSVTAGTELVLMHIWERKREPQGRQCVNKRGKGKRENSCIRKKPWVLRIRKRVNYFMKQEHEVAERSNWHSAFDIPLSLIPTFTCSTWTEPRRNKVDRPFPELSFNLCSSSCNKSVPSGWQSATEGEAPAACRCMQLNGCKEMLSYITSNHKKLWMCCIAKSNHCMSLCSYYVHLK